jgi:HK97 family phage major capsid protein
MLAKAAQFETIGTKAVFSTSAGWAPESLRRPGFVEAAVRPIQLLDILPTGRTGSDLVKYMEETTRTDASAEVEQSGMYPESAFGLEERDSPVRKIGNSIPVTDEQLEDVLQTQSYLDGRLMFGVRSHLDKQALIGTGATGQLRGLGNTTGIQTQAKGVGDASADAFYKAMTKIRVNGRAVPTHHVMHAENWQDIRLMKTDQGDYIWGHPSEAGPDRLWGLPVVMNEAGAAGIGYVGSFMPQYCELTERRGVQVQLGFVGTQFLQGQRTMRADLRVALTFFRPAAFCSVTGL